MDALRLGAARVTDGSRDGALDPPRDGPRDGARELERDGPREPAREAGRLDRWG